MTTSSEVLRLNNISKSFPGVKALTDVSFSLKKGEVHALVGENGAGKSTLMKILSGAYVKDSGTIEIDGEQVEIQNPKHAEKLGIAIIYQELNLINKVSIAENVFLGRYPRKHNVVQWKKMYKDAQDLFEKYGINIDAKAMIREVSIAQKQIVEIIKAVSINAKVVIMDEPTSSLTTRETEVLFNIIRALKANGISVIFITHRLDEIYAVCDRMTILRDGHCIGSRDVATTTKDEMISMMIGRELKQQYPTRNAEIGDVVLKVENLSDYDNKVKGVSFEARAGEVLGFAGLVGAGRTETMRLVFGADKKKAGRITIDGKDIKNDNPRQAIANRIGFVTENRKEEGLFLRSTVRVNTVIVAVKKILKNGFCLSFKKEAELTDEYVKRLRVVTPSIDQRVMFLSGGNQQKVVLAKWLLSDARIMILDEPTRGIDVGAKREIYEIINNLAVQGKVVIVISSEMEEIMGISDRILVMHEGKITGEVQKKDFSQKTITEFAVGGK